MEIVLEDSTDIIENKEYLFTVTTYEDSPASLLNLTQASYELNPIQQKNKRNATSAESKITLEDVMAIFEEK